MNSFLFVHRPQPPASAASPITATVAVRLVIVGLAFAV